MICYICRLEGEHESHHIIPLHLGGPKEGPQINLCSICHHNLHLIANRVYKGKSEGLELFSPDEWTRASLLVRAIVSSKIQIESTGKPPNSIQRLMIEIPNSLLVKLHIRKADLGFTSLSSYIKSILEGEAGKIL
jgi:hypothetical protein